jgi:NADPH-dependent 2,4-dienoyl-CoA reductase/sulfur reductase-like enzyme
MAVCREDEFGITPAPQPRKVAVVGGGPAGMEAARVCALRGHKVTLFEKRQLGGALLEASIPEFKTPDLRPFIDYLTTQVSKLGIKVQEDEATVEVIASGKYDAVIVAIGATPLGLSDVPGITDPKVSSASAVLHGEAKLGQKVAVIGGGIVGTEVGLMLAEQGKAVVFVEMLDTFMNHITPDEKTVYLERFQDLDVSVRTGQRLESVTNDGITVVDRFGSRMSIAADNVVLAAGFRPNRDLVVKLTSELPGLQIFEAGDCVEPRKILDAIHEGHLAARSLD